MGIGRSTVIRLLEEAKLRARSPGLDRRRWIGRHRACPAARARALKLDEVIVVPAAGTADQTSKAVGLALGKFLSETIADDMTIGVGWGRTLTASLASFHPPKHSGVKVMSLLGGRDGNAIRQPVRICLAARHGTPGGVLPVSRTARRRQRGKQSAGSRRTAASTGCSASPGHSTLRW